MLRTVPKVWATNQLDLREPSGRFASDDILNQRTLPRETVSFVFEPFLIDPSPPERLRFAVGRPQGCAPSIVLFFPLHYGVFDNE